MMYVIIFSEKNRKILEKGEVTVSQLNDILKDEIKDNTSNTIRTLLNIEKSTDLLLYKDDESVLIQEYCRGLLTQDVSLDMGCLTLDMGCLTVYEGYNGGINIKIIL